MSEPDSATHVLPPPERPRSGRESLLPWGLFGLALVLIAILGFVLAKSSGKVRQLEAERASLSGELEKLKQEREAERQSRTQFQNESMKLGTELKKTQAEKDAAKQALEQARKELSKQLAAQIQRGEVFIQQRGPDLVVDVSDKVLFDSGKAEIKDGGKEVLKQVASTLRRMPRHVFQVGGHTDSTPITSAEVKEKYPTNWELSAARSTTVVRFLAEKAGVPGRQLVAAGFERYRPAATNQTELGRARNRRIEIAVLKEQTPKLAEVKDQ